MKSTLLAIGFTLVCAAGAGWHFYNDEIREKLGWGKKVSPEIVTTDGNPTYTPKTQSPKTPTPKDAINPLSREEKAKAAREQRIKVIVTARYPDIKKSLPFSEAYPTLELIPKYAYPERITIYQAAQFRRMIGDQLVGASYVKKGGKVAPLKIPGSELTIASLADNRMSTIIPLEQTDFLSVVKGNYDQALADAKIRVQQARAADRSELLTNDSIFRKLDRETDPIWIESDNIRYKEFHKSLAAALPHRSIAAIGFFSNGTKVIDDIDGMTGRFEVGIALLEGLDNGFGPFLWRVTYFHQGDMILWRDLPNHGELVLR